MSNHDELLDDPPHLPPPTPWPAVMGVSITLMMAGMVVFMRSLPIEGIADTPDKANLGLLFIPLLGLLAFFVSLIMMLREDVQAFDEGGGH